MEATPAGKMGVSTRPDYFLAREREKRRFWNVVLHRPRHHDTDHGAIVASLYVRSERKMKAYRKRRQRFPLQLTVGPRAVAKR